MLASVMLVSLIWLLPLLILAAGAIYGVCRLRERSEAPDPHIGIKTAHHLFYTAGLFLLLIGVSVIAVEMMFLDAPIGGRRPDIFPGGFGFREPFFERMSVRIGLAVMLVGGAFALLHRLLLLATNDGKLRSVGRAFLGFRFAVTGILVMVLLSVILSMLFQKEFPGADPGSRFREIKPFLGMLIVWLPAWILFMTFLLIGTPRASASSDYGPPPMSSNEPFEDEGDRFR
jgi:hypothetical protein